MLLPDDKLKELLVRNFSVDAKLLKEAEELAKSAKIPLAVAVVEKKIATDEELGQLTATALNVPFVVLSKQSIPEDVVHIIPERVARKFKAIAFARDEGGVKVAMADPSDPFVLSLVARKVGERAVPYYATEKDIEAVVQLYKRALQESIEDIIEADSLKQIAGRLEDPNVAKIVDELIQAAYLDRASDIHIEPEEKNSLVRFRIDGVLQDVVTLKKDLHDRIITRIKVLSNLRTDEHHSAQDGKMQMPMEEETLDIRVSIIPITAGEKVVLRLLSSRSREYSLADLGMSTDDLKKVTSAFNKSYGMILSSGPTGSGKTTTIYAILKILNTREKNITTIEDPVEYRIKGANQVQVNPKTNLTFANGLRSILRQDPNIIFVGEIRDAETAAIAVNAALTGHLVLSTLHTNDASTAIPRLSDMKVEPFLVASTVNIIIAQRLVRKICEVCKNPTSVNFEELSAHFSKETVEKFFGKASQVTLYKGKGCKICRSTGYSGRIGIFEVLEVTKGIRKLITEKSDADIIASAAKLEGMNTMMEDGLEKVAKGETTIEEVIRATKVESL